MSLQSPMFGLLLQKSRAFLYYEKIFSKQFPYTVIQKPFCPFKKEGEILCPKTRKNLLHFRHLQFDVAYYQVLVGAFGVPLGV